MKNIYQNIIKSGKKQLFILLDPDKIPIRRLPQFIKNADKAGIDMFLAGGSLTSTPIQPVINCIKKNTSVPVCLFPGNILQLAKNADAILFLSLISGRNAEYLIGNHVLAAPFLKKSGIEIIPTGYILIEGGQTTSVEYISNTRPIPANKPDIAAATAIAGEMLGLKLIYLEAGSGAQNPVNPVLIEKVKQNINIPLIVGGGIKNIKTLDNCYKAGADIVVIGSALEQNPDLLYSFSEVRNHFNAI